jgi:crossover junction endodeoxyribonuclease RuvC
MKVLGVDPGYDKLGVAIVEKDLKKEKLLFSSCIKTKRGNDFEKRLLSLGEEFENIIKKWKPECVALETLYIHKNQKTAMGVSESRGVCTYIAAQHNLPIYSYTPIQIKETLTGYGRADKKQVSDMVLRTFHLPSKKREDDEFDAIAVALTLIYRDLANLSTQLRRLY